MPSASARRVGAAARGAALLTLACCRCIAVAAPADDNRVERARIATQRAQADARYEAQAADCRRRFVVTACLDDAQRERRDALDGLRRQQLLLDEAERRQRAADRIEAIRGKQAAAAADAAASSSRPTGGAAKAPPTTMRLRHAPSNGGRERPPAAAASDAIDSVEEPPPQSPMPRAAPTPAGKPRRDHGDRAAAHDAASEQSRLKRQHDQQARQAVIAAHRQAVDRRNAERAASAKAHAAPLPALPAAPASSAARASPFGSGRR